MYKFTHFVIIILFNYSVFAVDLPDALSSAYNNNGELQIIRQNFLSEIEQFSAAFSGFMPNVSYNINSNVTSNKPNSQYADSSKRETRTQQGTLIVEQPIFSGGSSVANLKAAQSSFRASRAKYYAEEQRVLLSLIKNYIDCYETKEKYEISEISLKTTKHNLETIEEKLKLGEATSIDLASAKAALAAAETNRLNLYASYQATKATFIRMFGIEANDIAMPSMPDNLPNSLEVLIQRAINVNPSIDSTRHNVKSQKAIEIAARAELLPKVNFRVESGKTIYAPEILGTSNINHRSTTSSLSVNIPIYSHGGSEYSRIRKAKNSSRSAAIQLDDTMKQIRASAIGSWEGFEAAKSRIIAASQGIEAAQIAYDGTMQGEIVGSNTTLEVLTAEEKLYNAKISKVDAYKDSILAAYQIKSLLGELTAKSLKLKVKYFIPEDEFKGLKKKLIIGF
ncbi:TolC family protein [Candidatus Tisiphia endosymbiont of Oplodontha viridula]|uniref:TolC family protein n=1 Tax=Candidatus Tisiphia endosymbiont of Oplodontha viridula TaxID=3077925 RepID=UPI0035C8CC67